MLSDEALLSSATRDHDRDAMAYFFERHQLSVYRTCLGVLRRSDLAEDAAQETFVSVLKQGSTVRPDGSVRGWLHRVAMNASLQVLRAERRRGRRERTAGLARLEAAQDGERRDLPTEAIDHAVLRRRINDLAARWRIPVLMRFEQGLPYKDIAEVLHVSEGTVASRLHRGLAQLREALEPAGVVVSTGDLEQAIAKLPPKAVSRELETSLRALAGGAAPASGGLSPRTLLKSALGTLLGIGLIGGIVLAVAIYWIATREAGIDPGGGGKKPPVDVGGGGIAPEDLSLPIQKALDTYNQALRNRFLDPTLDGQAASLLAELNNPNVMPPAHRDRPAISRLASILTECQNQQPTYAEMNWIELEQRAVELRNSPTVGKLADRIVEWVRAENTAKGHLGDGKEFMRSNRHDEAFSAFKQIDQEESVYSKEASQKMLELKGIITDRTAREANQFVRSGEFQSALDEINRVLNLFEGKYPDALVTLNPLKKECEKNLKYQNLVSEAEILIAQKRLDDAEAKLLATDLGAPPSILAKVERLKEDIGAQRVMSAANERYAQGDGKAAIQILQNETHPDLVMLRTRIQKVVDATIAAQNATAKNLLDEARRHWGEVAALEPDEMNRYHQEAVKTADGGATSMDAAKREHERGLEAQQANQLAEARQHYDKAMELFPSYQDSATAIKQFVRDAQKGYNFDRADFQKGKLTLEVIIPKWENVLGFLRPSDGPMYGRYKDDLEKLKTTGKF